jgi:hypothetical protein
MLFLPALPKENGAYQRQPAVVGTHCFPPNGCKRVIDLRWQGIGALWNGVDQAEQFLRG